MGRAGEDRRRCKTVIGRNTQGVRIMTLDEDDTLAAAVRVPREEGGEETPPETEAT